MTKDEIDGLMAHGEFPEPTGHPELVETHISWVVLCDRFVYKFKKPIKYSFLDFSTLEKRRHFCDRELELNHRFAPEVYIAVLPVYKVKGRYRIGSGEGTLVDFALKMYRMDTGRRMDLLVDQGRVSPSDIKSLAAHIVDFHKRAEVIQTKNVLGIQAEFNDLALQSAFLSESLAPDCRDRIQRAIGLSNAFLDKNKKLLHGRLKQGFYRDCHGDLHTRNIFLLPAPQLFDCIEFNDDFRSIDVLNEAAFLCMDLDAMGREDLSDLFIDAYNRLCPMIRNGGEYQLFIYYKTYRANVRMKVNSLRAKSALIKAEREKALTEAQRYLVLMEHYLSLLDVWARFQ